MINKILKKIRSDVIEYEDKFIINHRRRVEKKKILDGRRQKILNNIVLSESQKKSIEDLYVNSYGEKIPIDWHRNYTAYTGNFDKNYFPELLYIPEFEHFMNINKDYSIAAEDKGLLPLIADSVGVLTPKNILSCSYGLYRDENYRAISKNQANKYLSNCSKVFIKPSVNSGSGLGCMIIDMQNGVDVISGNSIDIILDNIGNNFVVQEIIKCHKTITQIYPNSVNTFRVITYRWKGNIEVMPVILRIGRGESIVDNAHAGGIFIGVDDNGTLHKTAFTEFCDKFTEHPDTKLVFENHKIEGVQKVIEAAKLMHSALPQIGSFNWDFTIDEHGEPVLIEANVDGGSIWLIEMAHGKGAFGENTKDILKWTRKMKMLNLSDRKKEFEKL